MEKRNTVLNSGIIISIEDALEQYSEKGIINPEQSLKSGIVGGIGRAVSSEMVAQNNHNQNSFSRLFTNPKTIFLIEEFVKQDQNLNPQEKKNILDFLKGYRIGLL